MKTLFLSLAILFTCLYTHAQMTPSPGARPDTGIGVPLRGDLDSSYYEYSGMAKWHNKVLLIPQYPDKWESSLFALDSIDIDKTIAGNGAASTPYTRIAITNLPEMRQHLSGTYQGFEGAVVVGNTIYFTLEFSEDTCYLLKGYISEGKNKTTVTLNNFFKLPKLHNAYVNAGYESIAYLPGSKNLIVGFEKNSDPAQPSVLLVDTSFTKQPVPVHFATPMYFRLTDMAATGKNTFIGINHYYNDYNRKRREYNYYIGDDNVAAAGRQMNDMPPTNNNYTGIVTLSLTGDEISWSRKKFISYGDENWEGIVPFKNGFLMVVDEYPKDGSPRMRYFEWDRN